MAANKSVTVLTPNGRQPTVKVSPNTTILQILEEVCQKHNFNPDDYDLKHFNRILDVNLILRYANISNNAKLEMVTCKNPRKVSNVTICIQLEEGSRQSGEFSPNTTIMQILQDLNVECNIDNALVIYTQREIYGKEFETVTLRSLGLASGKALLRLLHRDLKKPKEQAHVYVPPQPKVSKNEEDYDSKPRVPPVVDSNKNKVLDPISLIKAEKEKLKPTDEKREKECKLENESKKNTCSTNLSVETKKEEIIPMDIDENIAEKVEDNVKGEFEEEPKVEFLGERNALLFNQAGAKAIHQNDIPDSFFELTIKDAKTLLRDVRNHQSKLEDSPLLTSAQRALDKEKATLNCLHKYKKSVIRIQFPNQLILQGLFTPLETVQTVKDFVKSYLENPENDFILYTSPPRCDLKPEERLLDRELVPSARIYYSGCSDLKPDIKSKLTDPIAASFQAEKTRLNTMREDIPSNDDDEFSDFNSQLSTLLPVPSSSKPTDNSNSRVQLQPGPSTSRPEPSRTQPVEKSKMPKWLKLSK